MALRRETDVAAAEPEENTAQTSASLETQIVVREGAGNSTESDDVGDAQKPSEESLLAARDRMIALLAEARARGVVQIKNDSGDGEIATALSQSADSIAEENLATATPSDQAVASVTCIDPARFSDRPSGATRLRNHPGASRGSG